MFSIFVAAILVCSLVFYVENTEDFSLPLALPAAEVTATSLDELSDKQTHVGKLEISVSLQHGEKLSILSVQNNGVNNIFSLEIDSEEGMIRFAKIRDWTRMRTDSGSVLLSTDNSPLRSGHSLIALLKITEHNSHIWWSAFGENGNVISSGILVPENKTPIVKREVMVENTNRYEVSNVIKSAYITEFQTQEGAVPNGINVDKSGKVWFTGLRSDSLFLLHPTDYRITEYSIPEDIDEVWSIDFDAKGRIWFTDKNDRIWMFDPIRESFVVYSLPLQDSRPTDLLIDPMGRIWVTQLLRNNFEGDTIVMIDHLQDEYAQYRLAEKSGPAGITYSNGNIWLTQIFRHNIASFEPSQNLYREFTPADDIVSPIGIAVDLDGVIWFAQHGVSKVSAFDPTDKEYFEFTTSPSAEFPITTPYWTTVDSQGAVWFNEHSTNKIGRFFKGNNTLVEYRIPSERTELVNALTIALDRDDNLWFTEWSRDRIGFVNSSVPLPFAMDVSEKTAKVKAGDDLVLHLTLSPLSKQELQELYFNASSTITPTGEFVNSRVQFEPSTVTLMDGKPEMIRMVFNTDSNIQKGSYNMTISVSNQLITYSRIVQVSIV